MIAETTAGGAGCPWFTGDRVQLIGERRFRLPREERMRGYQDVDLRHSDLPFEAFDVRAVPVAVELRRGAESLLTPMGGAGAQPV